MLEHVHSWLKQVQASGNLWLPPTSIYRLDDCYDHHGHDDHFIVAMINDDCN